MTTTNRIPAGIPMRAATEHALKVAKIMKGYPDMRALLAKALDVLDRAREDLANPGLVDEVDATTAEIRALIGKVGA